MDQIQLLPYYGSDKTDDYFAGKTRRFIKYEFKFI